MKEHQKKIQYTKWYKNATGKGLWRGKDNEVSLGSKNIWRNIKIKDKWQD